MYLALYRKYRPRTFDDVISQDHITVTLKNQIKSGQTAHAYLFTGSRGTGKTTCAKILAKAVNCLRPVDGNPCLECESCRAIEDGATDVTEIDAASNNGVDNVRGLKEEAVYSPISCSKRVYIIDEVHMLSVQAFNALLKLIEEPPPHVVFIFATTEIHKIPATILSRCQRFEFRRIDINDSKKRLLEIAEKEQMQLDGDAAYLISRVSNGGMRDALSLLDQCFSVSSRVTGDIVRDCAGISGTEHLFRIADAVAARNAPAALEVLHELVERSKSPARLTEELISHYRTLMLLKAGADPGTLRITEGESRGFTEQNGKYTPEMLMRALSILSETLSGMSRTSSEELLCEMCLIRLCTPKLDTDEAALSSRIDALERLVLETVEKVKYGMPAPDAEIVRVPSFIPFEIAERPEAPAENITKKAETGAQPPVQPAKAEMPIDLPFDIDPPSAAPAASDPFPPVYFVPGVEPPFASEPQSFASEPQSFASEPQSFASEPRTVPGTEPPYGEAVPFGEPPPQESFPPVPPSLSEALGLPPPPPPPPSDIAQEQPKPAAEEAQQEAPEGYEPLVEWKTILESLPFSIRILIGDTTALINGSTVMVCGSELQKHYASEEFSETLTETVSRAIGRKVVITSQPAPGPRGGHQKLKNFLDLARSQGVNIKEEN